MRHDDEEAEEIPNMEEVFLAKKKKIALKLKNYKFTSVVDVLEGRGDKEMDDA